MSRRGIAILIAILGLIAGIALTSLPARASLLRDVAPTAINPQQLALPASALPAGTVIDHSAVSSNADADGATSPDGFSAQLYVIHSPTKYEDLGRITGYRMDFHFTIKSVPAGTEYLASIFPSHDKALAALDDATTRPYSLVSIIGKPLPGGCSAGDVCRAYYAPNPASPAANPTNVVFASFVRGPVLVESATQVPAAQYSTVEPVVQTALFATLAAADAQIRRVLSGAAATATATIVPTPIGTAPPTSSPTSAPAAPTATTVTPALFLHASLSRKTVKVGQKLKIAVTTLPAAHVRIVLVFPNKSKKTHGGQASQSGKFSWTFKQPKGKTMAKKRTVTVKVAVTDSSGAQVQAVKKYKIG